MNTFIDWLSLRWSDVIIPLVVFFAALIAAFWLRKILYEGLDRRIEKTRLEEGKMLLEATRRASVMWCLIVSVCLGLWVSLVPEGWKDVISSSLWSIFLLSLAMSAFQFIERAMPLWGERLKAPQPAVRLTKTAVRITLAVLTVLVLLDIWGVPTSPFLLLIAVAVLAGALLLRNTIPNWAAGLQLAATGQIKVGDYIRLETGEEGYVREMSWANIRIESVDESLILVPNRKLVESTVINYGRPLKRANEPFRFYMRVHLKELTGLKAKNLKELVEILKTAPDPVVYYHTHHFLEEHHYLTPEPANDFAVWVSDVLGDEALGEKLASVDTFEFTSLSLLRQRLVSIMEEQLVRGDYLRQVPEGREFHFMKSVSVILPAPYVAHDLREFVESLRKLSLGSLYFHIFESRMRLGKGLNDFSAWFADSLGEEELAEAVARLDPYTYTLEGLRSTLIQLIEKRIK
jgi:small-conductance mechanosensitive channel